MVCTKSILRQAAWFSRKKFERLIDEKRKEIKRNSSKKKANGPAATTDLDLGEVSDESLFDLFLSWW